MAGDKKVITKTALRRLMKNEANARIVALEAILSLQEFLNDKAVEITNKALALAKHAKRKTINKADIKLSI
jgi:histone H3/H4